MNTLRAKARANASAIITVEMNSGSRLGTQSVIGPAGSIRQGRYACAVGVRR
jgi:hypothetical protein